MQEGHVGRTEGRETFCALSPPELLDLPAPAETPPAATGSRLALCSAHGTPTGSVTTGRLLTDCVPTDGVPTESVTTGSVPVDSLLIAGVPTGADR